MKAIGKGFRFTLWISIFIGTKRALLSKNGILHVIDKSDIDNEDYMRGWYTLCRMHYRGRRHVTGNTVLHHTKEFEEYVRGVCKFCHKKLRSNGELPLGISEESEEQMDGAVAQR